MSNELANLLASRFIARRDVKAVQHKTGSWSPHTTTGKADGERIPWKREHLLEHIEGTRTFGHYLLDTDSSCKLFAFDIDLNKTGWLPDGSAENFEPCSDLRGEWLNRKSHARWWMKLQFKQMAHMLMRQIWESLEVPCAAAYSGGKGIHVYAFTGKMSAEDASEGARIVLDELNCFKPVKGEHFFMHTNEDPDEGFPNLSIEVFPKQSSLAGKDLGNLMRLPLGRNLKSTDPTFFIDMTSPLGDMLPVDPIWAMTTDDPWKRPGE